MAGTNDSTKAIKGCVQAPENSPPTSTASSSDNGLAEDRLMRYLSDETRTTVPFHSHAAATEQDVILAAKQRMAAKLLAFDVAFGQTAIGPS